MGEEADNYDYDAQEFLIDSGKLFQMRLKANSQQDFNEWSNAINQAIKECNRGRYDTFRVVEKENRRQRSINRY